MRPAPPVRAPAAGRFPAAPRGRLLACVVPLVLAAATARAGPSGPLAAPQEAPALKPASEPAPVHARLVCEDQALVPGRETRIGVVLELDDGWHVYGNARNDSGLPVEIELSATAGITVGAPTWPVPERLVLPGGILDHVYARRVTAVLTLRVDAGLAAPGAVTLRAKLDWMACKDRCLLGATEASLRLPLAQPGSTPARSPDAPLLAETDAGTPRPWPTAEAPGDHGTRGGPPPVAASIEGDRLRCSAPRAESLAFVPDTDCVGLPDLVDHGAAPGESLTLALDPARAAGARVRGCLVVRRPAAPPLLFRLDLAAPPVPPRG